MQSLISYISAKINTKVTECIPVSGGDISTAYKLKTQSADLFLKINNHDNGSSMFREEALGLETIFQALKAGVPSVLLVDQFESQALLLLEYVLPKSANSQDFYQLGVHLAKLHSITNPHFGFKSNNFIGSLTQNNEPRHQWIPFYVNNRLEPQLFLGRQLGFLDDKEVPSVDQLMIGLEQRIGYCKPALLHGDLWSGNYLISTNGQPYFIDPAVYFGHREVDLAMTRLFGGFGDAFYEAYYEIWPKEAGEEERIELYQLYFLLVHLNLFGKSYKPAVIRILRKYF
ncbi:MAG TPA: fructosamine kinase family protein [Saprospiraceae bacterium]|nr:fructosamine kinase family protein [Saprospiraceae bacterium]